MAEVEYGRVLCSSKQVTERLVERLDGVRIEAWRGVIVGTLDKLQENKCLKSKICNLKFATTYRRKNQEKLEQFSQTSRKNHVDRRRRQIA
jgi:hypothetical protein